MSTDRLAIGLGLLVIGGACSSPTPDRLSYPPNGVLPYGRLDPAHPDHDSFAARLHSLPLQDMKEPRLDPRSPKGAYRFTYMPSFAPQVALRLEPRRGSCLLFRRVARQSTDDSIPEIGSRSAPPRAGREWPLYYIRTLADSITLGDQECAALVATFDSLRFEADTLHHIGPDGEDWLFERVHDGRYAAIDLWSPPQRPADAPFVAAGKAMLRAAGYENGAFRRR